VGKQAVLHSEVFIAVVMENLLLPPDYYYLLLYLTISPLLFEVVFFNYFKILV